MMIYRPSSQSCEATARAKRRSISPCAAPGISKPNLSRELLPEAARVPFPPMSTLKQSSLR